jgi:tripartite-type tricarboxylate transporter receptor subunit TctC
MNTVEEQFPRCGSGVIRVRPSFSFINRLSLFFVALASAAVAHAQQSYPTRPLRLITGFLPGGVSDTIARVTGEKLGERLGQRVIIDGRPGAGGVVNMEIAAAANPDGHTLYLGQPVITLSPSFRKRPGFDPLKAFAPVSLIATGPTLLAVHPSLPVNSMKELIAYAKTQPGGLRFGSSGAGTTNHLSGELLRVMANIPLTHVPYRGAAVNVVAAIQGEIHISFLPLLAAIPHVKSGRLKALGVTGEMRSPSMPDIPAIGESLPSYEVGAWYGIVVPAATPQFIIKRVNAELVKVPGEQEVRDRLTSQGVDVQSSTVEELAELIRIDAIRWAKLVKAAGLVL